MTEQFREPPTSLGKAGAANALSTMFRSDGVKVNGPHREHPRRSWLGPEWQLLELLAVLPDDAANRTKSGSDSREGSPTPRLVSAFSR
jgi:hypothetical protein